MPKFLITATYTHQGLEGVRSKGGVSRRDAIAQAAESVGGTLETLYFAFGKHDVYALFDLPDNEAATALILAVNATGAVKANTVVLLTPEEVDAAIARSVSYRAPGT
ncbi:MAG: hypothetical protein QOG70_2186 [Solirubrobacteraceae bacterium]|jgi:uncharacterized protein with GYD domain|nr:hypothetical protein [Solirubrobacteraceae bacterium]